MSILIFEMNNLNRSIPSSEPKELVVCQTQKVTFQHKIKKILFAVGGLLALALAILGIVVPGLPCTPFALLSAALFAKSSERLYNKLLANRILGPRIKNYQRRKGISKSGKIKVIILMWAMVLLSSLVIVPILTIKIIILSAGIVGAFVVWFFVPEGKEPEK